MTRPPSDISGGGRDRAGSTGAPEVRRGAQAASEGVEFSCFLCKARAYERPRSRFMRVERKASQLTCRARITFSSLQRVILASRANALPLPIKRTCSSHTTTELCSTKPQENTNIIQSPTML